MTQFFEILKYILPALIVFITVYYTMKQYLNSQYNLQYLKNQNKNAEQNIPIKLQAYERLLLLMERIRLTNLVFRLRSSDMNVKELTASLLISIQKEFEHNQAQQLYVSSNLWNIIKLAKENVQNIISESSTKFPETENSGNLANMLMMIEKGQNKSSVDVAIEAIKKEAQLILKTP